jgi:FAD-dependent urate hydroxylase
VRAPAVQWLHARPVMHHQLNPFHRLLWHPTDVGPPGLTHLVGRPDWFRRVPLPWQPRLAYRCIRPAASAWLKPRASGIHVTTNRTIVSAVLKGDRVSVKLDDGTPRTVDHLLLATGYRVDVMRHAFLAGNIAQSLQCFDGYPDLGAGFESSVAGLHFIGAPAARSFGPLMRFVSGTSYTARALTRRILRDAGARQGYLAKSAGQTA